MDIIIRSLRKTYRGGVTALDGIDLDIRTGMFALLGQNGAGKTTLMRILAGILRPTAGSVTVGAHDLAAESGRLAVKRTLGYLPQELALYPDLTAAEFLDYIAVLKHDDDRAARRRRIRRVLDEVGLADLAGRKLKRLSGGMKRRVGIAQALLNDPRLLIVDEPTVGLDPEERIRFRTLLAEIGGDRTVLLSTHIVDDIAQTCRRLAVLAAGRVHFSGTVTDLTAAAADHVWTLTAPPGPPPQGPWTVVSAVHHADCVTYRIVGQRPATLAVAPATPTLEDGYVHLMQTRAVARAA